MAEWDAEAYGRINDLQAMMADRALQGLALNGAERVLDVGCGDGRVTAAIAARLPGGHVVGVDQSASMIGAARERLGTTDRATFVVADAAELSFRSEFDLVVSFNALHWVTAWPQALRRIRNAVHAGGQALLVLVCDGDRPSLEDVVTTTAEQPHWRRHITAAVPFVHVNPDAYAAAATSDGWVVDDLRVDDVEWEFGTRAAFFAWASAGLVAWTSQLPPASVQPFLTEVLDTYADVVGSESRFAFLQLRAALTLPI